LLLKICCVNGQHRSGVYRIVLLPGEKTAAAESGGRIIQGNFNRRLRLKMFENIKLEITV